LPPGEYRKLVKRLTPMLTWYYIHELQRKASALEFDRGRVKERLAQARDEPTKRALTYELQDIDRRLAKLRRGLLY
jgi:hypothetical protein